MRNLKSLGLNELSKKEMSNVNGGWDEFWDGVFDYYGVPEEYRIF